MANHQRNLAGNILERISTDRAVHEAFQRFADELQGFRSEVVALRREMAKRGT